MKKIMLSICAAATFAAIAADAEKKTDAKVAKDAPELKEEADAPLFWGFGNYGIYSGYQLYGSLVNSEPTLQGYAEGNFNLLFSDDLDLGYLGIGIWSNSDLTKKRDASYGRAFNEWDFNVHWGRTFWFDDARTWGLGYRTSVVWYYYPHHLYQGEKDNGDRVKTDTTMDWNHYVELVNPYVIPYLNAVHEYHESDGNILQFGLKKTVAPTDALSLTPCLEFVWRNTNYGWCFPHYGKDENWHKINSCLATMKIGVDANYQITEHFGIFAKVAFCSTIDGDMRDAADACVGDDYGKYKDFAWGGVGVNVNF